MVVELRENVLDEEKDIVYKLYYDFYNKLYRKPLIKSVFDDSDFATNHALTKLATTKNLKMLKVLDYEKNILAVSRFLIDVHELLVGEILLTDNVKEDNQEKTILMVMKLFEHYTKKMNIPKISLELPWYDKLYQRLAKEQEYIFPDDVIFKYDTLIVEKNITKTMGEENEWTNNRR